MGHSFVSLGATDKRKAQKGKEKASRTARWALRVALLFSSPQSSLPILSELDQLCHSVPLFSSASSSLAFSLPHSFPQSNLASQPASSFFCSSVAMVQLFFLPSPIRLGFGLAGHTYKSNWTSHLPSQHHKKNSSLPLM